MPDFIKEIGELRILILEDVQSDAELEEAELRDAGLACTTLRVDTREAFERALEEFKPTVVLVDYRLPAYSGREALEYTRSTHPDIPVILATGAIGDEAAVEMLKLGAKDYVLKDRLARLAPAIRRALSEEMGVRQRKLAEGKYRALFYEAMDGIVLLDCRTWRYVDCNPEFEKQTGRTLEQLAGIHVWEVFPPDQQQRARQGLREIEEFGSKRGSDFTFQKPDGEIVPFEYSAKYLDIQGQCFIQVVTHDITDRLRSEQAMRESEARYKRITEGLTDYLYTVRIENGCAVETRQTAACVNVTGYRAEEFTADPYLWIQMVPSEDRELVLERVNQVLAGKDVAPIQHRIIRKDGKIRWVSDTIILFKDASGKLLSYDGVIRDITERVLADLELRESEEKFHGITSSAQDAIMMLDDDGNVSYWNAAAEKIFGYSAEEIMGRELHTSLAPQRFHAGFHKGFSHFLKTGEGPIVGKTVEMEGLRKDGTEFPLEVSLSAIKRGGKWHAVGIVRDITERKQAEEKLRETSDFLENLFNHANAPIVVWNPDYRITMFNHAFEHMTGRDVKDIIGRRIDILFPAERMDEALAQIYQTRMGQRWETVEIPIQHANGTVRTALWNSATLYSADGKTVMATIAQGQDITERKQAEAALLRANRALKTLSAGNMALVEAKTENELLKMATNVIVEQGGYALAVVAYAEHDPEKTIWPMAWSGMEDNHYWIDHLSWGDTVNGQIPSAQVIRTGKTQICHDIASDPVFKPWRDGALARGYVSNIALPLSGGGRTFGSLSIYLSEPSVFDEEEVLLLEELANDLAYGIITLRTKAEHEQYATMLRQSLEQSIQTIAGTVEARDPYTAGHQRRVAELAMAIAQELNLSEEQINGIHFAAIIHDLGKIHIPAEILSKPGKLKDIELMLIKTHPQAGYDIVKDVKFPWPIATLILQHHERLDGSGYPQGLKDKEIMLESKILTVADVVEAMSSHRPYRPALGIKAALAEIELGRGSSYDPMVVDACLRLFAEKGFRFSKE